MISQTGDANLKGGGGHHLIILANFPKKLHENEAILVGGGASLRLPVDQPIIAIAFRLPLCRIILTCYC